MQRCDTARLRFDRVTYFSFAACCAGVGGGTGEYESLVSATNGP
jgi:hypothetical protein